MRKISICGTGCSLLDYVYANVNFSGGAFKKYNNLSDGNSGLRPGQLVFLDDLERSAGKSFERILPELCSAREADSINIGGPSIVAMIHAGQLLMENADLYLVAAVGSDNQAKKIKKLTKSFPQINFMFTEKVGRTPFTYVLSDPDYNEGQGERTFVNNIGVAGSLNILDIPANFYEADILALGGTALVPELHKELDIILERASNKAFRIVNTVFDFVNESKFPGRPWPVGKSHDSFKNIDLLIMNHQEAIKISGFGTLQRAVQYFADSPLGAFIITEGAKDIVVGFRKTENGRRVITRYPVCEKIVKEQRKQREADTTGAGDNFVGGIIYSLSMQLQEEIEKPDLDLEEALSWGALSGGFACCHLGGTFAEKFPGEKLHIIKTYHESYIDQLKEKI